MAIYRRKLPSGKRCGKYTAEFRFRGRLYRQHGFPDRESARFWVRSQNLKLQRHAVGFVKSMIHALVPPQIDAFAEYLDSRGRDSMYIYTARRRLIRLASECNWQRLGHATRESLAAWMTSDSLFHGKSVGPRTKNQFLDIAVEWGEWLTKPAQAILSSNPFTGIDRLSARHNNAYRRAGTLDELNRLLANCSEQRRIYYLFRIYTPIRAKTISQLTWGMMRLDASPPFASTPAAINKSRKDERHVIRYDVAQQLRHQRGRAKASDLVFPDPPPLSQLKADLEAADVAFDDGKGNRRLDYHALRRTLVRIGKQSGLTLDQASQLLGHRDARTTRKYYDDDAVAPEIGESMERLPAIGTLRRAQ